MDVPEGTRPGRRVFGRDADVERIVRLLAPGDAALVTITGRGGVGKTALADLVARRLGDDERVVWVPLAGVTDARLVIGAIGTALGATVQPGGGLDDAVVAELRHGSPLLVLDNAEHLLEAAPALGELFGACPALRVLVTSQAPLRLRSEQVVDLAPLPVPADPEAVVQDLAEQPAVATYCQRARAVDLDFALTTRNAAAVAELCRRLDGLPLAIELAAARSATLPAGEILRRLDDAGLGVLHRRHGDAHERHHGLRAAIEWTYGLLDPGEQSALRHLSVLVGTFDLDAAVALIGGARGGTVPETECIDQLSSLVDFHLVDPSPGSDPARFSMAESIRSFAHAELHRLGALAEVDRLRIRVRARQAGHVADGSEIAHGEGRIVTIEANRDDLLASLQAALQREMGDEALDLVRGLGAHWDLRGYEPVHERLVDAALQLGARTSASPVRMANAMLWSAFLGLRHSRDADQAELIERIGEAEQLGVDADDLPTRFHAQCVWLLVSPFTGDLARAEAAAEEGLRLAELQGDPTWCSIIQVWAGMLANLAGDERTAAHLGMEALATARRSGDHETVVRAAMLLGPIAARHPDLVTGLPSTSETLASARELGLPFYEALLLVRLVNESLREGNLDAALTWMSEALGIARTMMSSPTVGFDLIAMSMLSAAFGDAHRTALFHGTVRESLPLLERFLLGPELERYRATIDGARAELGDECFERKADAGAAMGVAEALHEATTYVQGLCPASTTDPTAATTDLAAATAAGSGHAQRLTTRQLEVLRLLAAGLSNKEIAAELGVRAKTVMHHTTAIYRALDVRGRSEATAVAFRSNLV